MEENISEKSGFVRLALGTGLTACGIAHLAKDSGSKTLGTIFVAAGALKVAEGIFLYCPAKALINSNVKEAVATTFDEYLDGDSLMQAYNQTYENKWNEQGNTQKGNNSSQGQTMKDVAKAASQVAQTVSEVAPNGTMAKTASQAVKTVADSVSGNQKGNQNKQGNKNKSSNTGQSQPS